MTAQQFYLKNQGYLKKAQRQEMNAIFEKRFLTIKDVKEFMKLAGRPDEYIKSRMEELSQKYYGSKVYAEMYGSEINYIVEVFRGEMANILKADKK